jgi:hypothetical protein
VTEHVVTDEDKYHMDPKWVENVKDTSVDYREVASNILSAFSSGTY